MCSWLRQVERWSETKRCLRSLDDAPRKRLRPSRQDERIGCSARNTGDRRERKEQDVEPALLSLLLGVSTRERLLDESPPNHEPPRSVLTGAHPGPAVEFVGQDSRARPDSDNVAPAQSDPIVCFARVETSERSEEKIVVELRHLRYFVAVAEDLHFGRAANRLHTSQSSLSQQIRNLETELKVDLLRRVKRHVELTPAGTRFLREARGILAAAERAAGLARETAREESQKIVIGISPETDWQFLGKALRLFREHAPNVEVLFQNLAPEGQVDALHGGRIDIGFVGLPIEAEGVVSEVTGRERLVAAISEKHPMARSGRIRLRDLSGEAYTLWPRHLSPGRYDLLLSIFRRAGFGQPIPMEGGSSLDPDRPGNGRRGLDRGARRFCHQAARGARSRLPRDRR